MNNRGGQNKLTTVVVIKRLKKIFKNENYSYKSVKYIKHNIYIKLLCKKKNHGFFKRQPKEIWENKRGCPNCFLEAEKTKFIEEANKKHKHKYDYSKVIYKTSKKNVLIGCDIKSHGFFKSTPDNHKRTSGCPKCGIIKMSSTQAKSHKEFIKDVKIIHGDKYLFKKTKYKRAKLPVIVTCKIHGDFTILPTVLYRSGCLKCGLITAGKKRRLNTKTFIERAKKLHGQTYNYDYVKYKLIDELVKIKCKHHGIFYQTPEIHLNGSGCSSCGNDQISLKMKNSIEKVISRFVEKRGIGNYDYSNVFVDYKNNRSIVLIKCLKHNKFFRQRAQDHEMGGGCEKCNIQSVGEELIMSILSENKISFIHNWNNHNCFLNKAKAKFDFYIKKSNLIIEYDGEQHFKPVQYGNMTKLEALNQFKLRKKYDKIKDIWAKKNKINLLRIKYDDKPKVKILDKLKDIKL